MKLRVLFILFLKFSPLNHRAIVYFCACWFFAFTSFTSAEPSRPIIFIPGILGSKIADENGKIVWGGLSSYSNFSKLELPADDADISHKPAGIIENIPIVWPLKIKQYDGLIDTLEKLGYKQGESLFLFDYDWRRSNFKSAQLLNNFIETTPELAGNFDIVAHSMGGIVSIIFNHIQPAGQRLKNLITLGTPYLGSQFLVERYVVGFTGVQNWLTRIGASEDEIRKVLFSFESGYELLPSYQLCCIKGSPADPSRQPIDLFTTPFWEDAWLPDGFTSVADKTHVAEGLTRGQQLKELVAKPLPPQTKVFRFAGEGYDTLTQIYFSANGDIVERREFSGDGTVFLASAASDNLPDSRVSFNKHARIFDDESVRAELKRILIDDVTLEDFAASSKDIKIRTKHGEFITVESLKFEAVPPLVVVNDVTDIVLTLSGSEVILKLDDLEFLACVDIASTSQCFSLKRDVVGKARFTTKYSTNQIGVHILRIKDIPQLEDYIAVTREDGKLITIGDGSIVEVNHE